MMRLAPTLCILLGLAGCAPQSVPVTVEQAELICLGEVRNPARTRSTVSLGTGFGGGRSFGGVSVEIPADALLRRNPDQIFARCVQDRSGQVPSRPLASQPGWTGR